MAYGVDNAELGLTSDASQREREEALLQEYGRMFPKEPTLIMDAAPVLPPGAKPQSRPPDFGKGPRPYSMTPTVSSHSSPSTFFHTFPDQLARRSFVTCSGMLGIDG